MFVTKNFQLLFLTMFSLQLCGCSSISINEQLGNELCEAYYTGSDTLLTKFFEKWEKEITPISDTEYEKLSDTLKTVYTIYNDYCNYKIDVYPNAFRDSEYYTIQNEIKYTIANTKHLDFPIPDSTKVFSQTLMNFRPFPRGIKKKIVYMSSTYKSVLESFIKNQSDDENENKYSNGIWRGFPRANFLDNLIQLRASMFRFHFYTLPYISLDFNNDFSEVIIHSILGNTWAKELFILSKNEWKFQKSYLYGIE